MKPLGIRHRLLLTVIGAVAIALVAFIAGFNVILTRTLDRDAGNLVRSRAVAQIDSLRVNHGKVTVGEAPDDRITDAYVWVFAGPQLLEQPQSAAEITEAARRLARRGTGFLDLSANDVRLYAAPVVNGTKRLGTVVAGVSLAPYEQTRKLALIGSIVFGALVLLLVAGAAQWLLRSSLRPVARMTRQAADWSERDVEQRFALGSPHDELTELAATLDRLLERLAASLRHERRFSAELSHELRTPLSRVLAESELALKRERAPHQYRESLELIHRNAEQLARTVDALVAAARYEVGARRGTADARAVADAAAHVCHDLAALQRLRLEITDPGQPVRLGLDGDLAERILQPILENACRYSAKVIRLSIARENSTVLYTIEDDGPGVSADERERIFEAGVRGQAPSRPGGSRAGLGLALARRLARSVDGDVAAEPRAPGGRFVIRLPGG